MLVGKSLTESHPLGLPVLGKKCPVGTPFGIVYIIMVKMNGVALSGMAVLATFRSGIHQMHRRRLNRGVREKQTIYITTTVKCDV